MFNIHRKDDIFTIPNLLSLARLLLIPVYIPIYLRATEIQQYHLAGGILLISCLTDFIDGRIARRFHMVSQLGKFLDPLADKLTQLALFYCLSLRHPPLRTVLLIFLGKEIFQSVTALIMLRHGKILSGAIPAGKCCTAVLFSSSILLILIPDLEPWLVRTISVTDSVFLVFALISYAFAFYGGHAQLQDYHPS